MKRFLLLLFIALFSTFSPVTAHAQDAGEALLASTPDNDGNAQIIGDAAAVHWENVAVEGQNFARAWRLQTVSKPQQPQSAGVEFRNVIAVKRGDVLLADFWTRAAPDSANSPAAAWVAWQEAQSPWADSLSLLISADKTWKHWQIPFVAARDYNPNEARWVFFTGYQTQTLDIAALSLRRLPATTKLETAPRTAQIYDGQQPDAAWRAEAQKRIEQHRKGTLQVLARDKNGAILPDATIRVRMQKHAFLFGASINEARVLDDDKNDLPNNARYRDEAKNLFNSFTLEGGATRWYAWESQNGQFKRAHIERGRETYSWLRSHSRFGPRVNLRAVPLLWPSWRFSGASARPIYENTLAKKGARAARKALRERVREHIRETMQLFGSQVDEWDVVNEILSENDISNVLGRDAVVEWLQIVRQSDADAKIGVNEFGILSGGALDEERQNALFDFARDLLQRGAPLDYVGFQGHMGASPTAPEKLLQILNRFAQLNRAIEITEFDTTFADPQLQADYTRDFLTVMFSHPNVRGVTLWGFWDGAHWKDNGALFNRDWTLKPAGAAWKKLVFDAWWTNADGKTDTAGRFSTRAFYGDYEITLEHNSQTVTKTFTLKPDSAALEIALP